jgi:rubrerythrin
MNDVQVNESQLNELLLQALETEMGGVQLYRAALQCAADDDLREEWEEYLGQTERHEQILRGVLEQLGLDPELETPGRLVVRHIGASLLKAITMARASGDAEAAQLVATECIALAEAKDHQNWELIGEVARHQNPLHHQTLQEAYDQVEDEEDEHYYHTKGWSRELWIQSLGLPAVIPPPEEEDDVRSALGAAQAKAEREELL